MSGFNVSPIAWRDIPGEHDTYDKSFDPIGYVGRKDGLRVGFGAVLKGTGGDLWALFVLYDNNLRYHKALPVTLHRRAVRMLDELERRDMGPIYTVVEKRNEYSESWMKRLGFKPTGKFHDGMEIWGYDRKNSSSCQHGRDGCRHDGERTSSSGGS